MAVLSIPALANPPYAGANYTLVVDGIGFVGSLNISSDAATLGPGSFVRANCMSNAGSSLGSVYMNLASIPISNPAGVISTFLGPKRVSAGSVPGTVNSPRFFLRFFPKNSGPPTSGPPPQGPPTGGTSSGPGAGDIGTGTVSARNNPPKIGNQLNFAAFCSFSLNLFTFKS